MRDESYIATTEILGAVRAKREIKPFSARGRVVRIEDDGLYVRLDGSELDTPVSSWSVEASVGDVVDLEVSHRGLLLKGNRTSPAAATRTVEKAQQSVEAVRKYVESEFVRAQSIEAVMIAVRELNAAFAAIGDLDVESLVAASADIKSLNVDQIRLNTDMTAILRGLYGHYEDALVIVKDSEGNDLLDSNGNPVWAYEGVWVQDNKAIAERLETFASEYVSLVQSEQELSNSVAALQDAMRSSDELERRVRTLEGGLQVIDQQGEDGEVEKTYVHIGERGSVANFVVTNDFLAFVVNDENGFARHTTTMTGEAMTIENAEVSQYLKVGKFAWKPRLDGGLTFQWIGG